MKKRAKILILTGALAGALLLVLRPFGEDAPDTSYRTQRVINNQLRIAVSATGTLNPVRVVSVGTQISGTIREIAADWNDQVKEGQLLVKLDDELFRAKVLMSEANLASAESQLELARIRHARQERLFAAGSSPREELDTAAANLAMAEAAVAQSRAQLAQDRYNLDNTSILSPVDGVVINRAVDVGQTVAASFQTPTLIDIAQDLSKMQIDASFAEADIGRLSPGLSATFTVDAYPGSTFRGALRQIRLNPTVNSNVVTYNVVVDVDNRDLRLLPGMTAYVDIELYREDDAILIPNAALNYRPGGGAALPPGLPGAGAGAEADAGDRAGAGPAGAADAASAGQGGAGPAADGPEAGAAGDPVPEVADDGSGEASSLALAALVIPKKDDPPGRGRAYVLGRDGRPVPVDILTGATDLRYTVVRGGALKPGDMVITSESANGGEAQGTLFGGSGGARGGPRPF
ncbi:MAG: efflux RND transporter periplasmic adaptor subunit [Deltaproteobacteria bacterium]|jgi:HlyD family secretion protein|nr:efflux RND transporter periplasmic adaptor subunit [Deltaproteobacteria bacterium]